jgi:hypothetical protein
MSTDKQPGPSSSGNDLPGEARTKRQVAGTVIARWQGTSKALIRLDTGAVIEAVGADQLEDVIEVGAAANVYFDADEAVVGWMLIDLNMGVNLERSASE